MSKLDRRSFNKLLGAAAMSAVAASVKAPMLMAKGAQKGVVARVVIIGGGAGGASVAHLLKKNAPQIDVTLIEPRKIYTTCFMSNHYIGGFRSMASLQHSYDGLKKIGVKVVHELATGVDAERRLVFLKSKETLPYDKLVLSPGIELKYSAIEGYTPDVAKFIPHAWLAGEQSVILRRRLLDMTDGGTFVMSIPKNPYRCPAAPYERATLIAHYLKYHKPASKIILLDAKSVFPKMELFEDIWSKEYKGMVEWVAGDKHGGVIKVIANEMALATQNGEKIKGDVINLIPPQKAGEIVSKAGCAAGDWCPVVPDSLASRQVKDVFVLGDASNARKMPKTASSANSQAQTVANVIMAQLLGAKMFPPRYRNTCWSLVSVNNALKDGASYTAGEKFIEEKTAFSSDIKDDPGVRAKNFRESLSWYRGVTNEMFAKG